MYIDITTTNVPAVITESPVVIQCNISVSGNMATHPTNEWPYFDSTVSVTCSSLSGRFSVSGSPVTWYAKRDGFSGTADFTVTGLAAGSDTVQFEAEIAPDHETMTCTRSETEQIPVSVVVNAPPVLSSGSVAPASGDTSTDFTFDVTYTDAEGDLPEYVTCTINSQHFPMTVKDGSIDSVTTGEIFTFTTNGTNIGPGPNTYNFSAMGNGKTATGDITVKNGPIVDSPPVCVITSPLDGVTIGGLITISGTASDPDTSDDITKVEISLNDSAWEDADGTTAWSYETDLYTIGNGPLNIKARSYNGAIYSDVDEIDITVDNSVANTVPVLSFELSDNTVAGPDVWINGTLIDPELPNQTVGVMLGIDADPVLAVNLTEDSGTWTWSILLDLWGFEEGDHDIKVKAVDPFSTSIVKTLKIVLDIPNSLPLLTIDDVDEPLWGEVEFSGIALDDDNDTLDLQVSWDNTSWEEANIGDGQWNWSINASEMEEKAYTFYVSLTDGEDTVILSIDVQVKGPFEPPVIISTTPDGTTDIDQGDEQTFSVVYKAGDHRGVRVYWSSNKAGLAEDKGSILLKFLDIGTQTVTVLIENAEDPTLSVSYTWTVNVLSTSSIEAKGKTSVTAIDDEAVILELDITGEVDEIIWTINGEEVAENKDKEYMYFLEEEAGSYTITAQVSLKDGTEQTITYTVTVPEKEPNGVDDDDEESLGVGAAGLIAIGSVGLVLILVIILVMVLVIMGVLKKRASDGTLAGSPTQTGPPPGETMVWDDDETAMDPDAPSVGPYPQQDNIPTQDPADQYVQPQTDLYAHPDGPLRPHVDDEQMEGPSVREEQLEPEDGSEFFEPDQPMLNCPTCGDPAQFYPEHNAYWCERCQSYVS